MIAFFGRITFVVLLLSDIFYHCSIFLFSISFMAPPMFVLRKVENGSRISLRNGLNNTNQYHVANRSCNNRKIHILADDLQSSHHSTGNDFRHAIGWQRK